MGDIPSRSTVLYPLCKLHFIERIPTLNAIESYDNALDSFGSVVKQQFTSTVIEKSTNGHLVKVTYFFDNYRIVPALTTETTNKNLPGTPTLAMQTGRTYGAAMLANTIINIEIDTDQNYTKTLMFEEIRSIFEIIDTPVKNQLVPLVVTLNNTFSSIVPILVGSRYCSTKTLDEISTYFLGEDITNMGGYVILNGQPKQVGSMFDYIYNRPTATKNEFKDQVARTEILFRERVLYGNSYYLNPLIYRSNKIIIDSSGKKLKTKVYDIIIRPSISRSDVNKSDSAEENINRIPIKCLFHIYGANTDKEIANYIFPGPLLTKEKMIFISDVLLLGEAHNKYRTFLQTLGNSERGTRSDSLLYVAEIMMKEDNKILMKTQAVDDVSLFLTEHNSPMEQEELEIALLQKRHIKWADALLQEYFMPNLFNNSDHICIELGRLVAQLIKIVDGTEIATDRTSLESKSIHQIGEQLIREFISNFYKTITVNIDTIIKKFIEDSTSSMIREKLGSHVTRSLTGLCEKLSNKMVESFKPERNSSINSQPRLLAAPLELKSILESWSKVREVIIRPGAGDKQKRQIQFNQRKAHLSYFLFFCVDQTPEGGSSVGRFHQPTLYMRISIAIDDAFIKDLISKHKDFISSTTNLELKELYVIRVNQTLLGYVSRGDKAYNVYRYMMEQRRTNPFIDFMTGIDINHIEQTINLNTSSGRACIPLIPVVRFNDPKFSVALQRMAAEKMTWTKCLEENWIEYFDAHMMNNVVVATSLDDYYKANNAYTHIMLPGGSNGLMTAVNPAVDRTKGVRSLYLTSHIRSAIGWPVHNYTKLNVAELNIIDKPQRPLVYSIFYEMMEIWRYAFGNHYVVAYMPYAENQEDSVIVNRASVDRGIGLVHNIKTMTFEVTGTISSFGLKPRQTIFHPIAPEDKYGKIDPVEGIPTKIGIELQTGDVICAKARKLRREELDVIQGQTYTVKDESEVFKIIDKKESRHPTPAIMTSFNAGTQGNNQKKSITTFTSRYPEKGDKFSSEHGQKFTVGIVKEASEMPYTANGKRVDAIFNPSSIVKRETYGHNFVSMLNLICALMGSRIECTPFISKLTTYEKAKLLKQFGIEEHGEQILYNGITGEPFKTKIYVGVEYWLRQKHMVDDKQSVRNKGMKDTFTRQPAKGKKQDGGMKLGEMEIAAMNAAGVSMVTVDAVRNRAAPQDTYFCSICGGLAYPMKENKYVIMCDKDGILPIMGKHYMRAPYNIQLLNNMMGGAGIGIDTKLI